MTPILYENNETAFVSNGICRLRDAITCVVVEERNGIYECDFTYPVTGANYSEIRAGRIVGVAHDEAGDVQPFEIVSATRPIDGIVSFHAVHISYRLSQMTVAGTGINSLAAAFTLLGTALPSNPFTFWTNKNSSGYLAAADGTPRSVRQMLGGVQGSILDAYGGEYEFDRFMVKLWQKRGKNRDYAIRYGVNLLNYQDETDYQGTFTSCSPYWIGSDGEIVTTEATLNLTGYNGNDIRVPLDLTDKFEEAPTTAQLEAAAVSYMQNNQTYLPAQNIKVDFVRLADMPEYEDFENLLACKLCDNVKVIFAPYGVEATFKVVRVVWDVLQGRYQEIELGALRTTLAEALGVSSGSTTGTGGGGGVGSFVIPKGQVDGTSTSTVFTATIDGIDELKNGVCCYLTNGVVTSASGFTLNINGLGAKPCYSSMAAATQATTVFNANYTFLFVYNEDRVAGGCWDIYYGYDSNSNTIGYQLRTNSMTLPMANQLARYRLLFTSQDGSHFVAANNSTSTSATTAKTVTQIKIDPFGDIRYYSSTTSVNVSSHPGATALWQQYVVTLGYSFNRTGAALTLISRKPVYVVAAPQEDGSAIIDSATPFVQDLPTSEDGKIYIYLGVATSETQVELCKNHPVYCFRGGRLVHFGEKSQIHTFTPTTGNTISGRTCYYARSENVVTVGIAIERLVTNSDNTVFTLPTGFRPKYKTTAACYAGTSSMFCYMEVGNDGIINVRELLTGTEAIGSISFVVE